MDAHAAAVEALTTHSREETAILKLRALRCNGDLDTYWQFHLNREHHRLHDSRYANGIIPTAA